MPRDEPPIRQPEPPVDLDEVFGPNPIADHRGPLMLSRRAARDLAALLLVLAGVAGLDVLLWLWQWQAGAAGLAAAAIVAGVLLGLD